MLSLLYQIIKNSSVNVMVFVHAFENIFLEQSVATENRDRAERSNDVVQSTKAFCWNVKNFSSGLHVISLKSCKRFFLEAKNEVAQRKYYDLVWAITVYGHGYAFKTPEIFSLVVFWICIFFHWNHHRIMRKASWCQNMRLHNFYDLCWVIEVYVLGYDIQDTIDFLPW